MAETQSNPVTGEQTFEEALTQLETITSRLESGDLPLEEALALYEQGVRLTSACNAKLKAAKLKIEELRKPQNEEE